LGFIFCLSLVLSSGYRAAIGETAMTVLIERKKRAPRKPPPTLELTAEMLKAPTLFTLDVIKSLMLWPDDDARRHLAMQWAILKARRAHARDGALSQVHMLELIDDAFDVLPRAGKFIIEAEGDRIQPGSIAGEILLQKLGLSDRRLESIKGDIGLSLTARKRRLAGIPDTTVDQSSKTVNNIWGQFLPVAHFWAAVRLIGRLRDFPCRRDSVGRFLRVADRLRCQGEQTRLANRQFLLPRGAAVLLPEFMFTPEFMQLYPEVEIEFAPLN
jgi:hypothetical protein